MTHPAPGPCPTTVWTAILLFGFGLASGVIQYLGRSGQHQRHQPGTDAWIPHLCLAAVGLCWLLIARARRSSGTLLLLVPLGRPAAARVVATFRTGGVGPGMLARRAGSGLLLVLMVYSCWRFGDQVTGGLDPNFTANAWGGPSYLGAMFCHYLDGTLILATAAALLDRLLVGRRPRSPGTRSALARKLLT